MAALGDDHARWAHGMRRPPAYYDGDQYGLGLQASTGPSGAPGNALPPLFVTAVQGGPARAAGVRPGDVIESIDGSAPFVGAEVTPAAVAALYPRYPQAAPVRLRLLRQDTGRRRTVTLKPRLFQPDPDTLPAVTAEVVDGDVARVRMRGFAPDSANRVLRAIARLRTGRTLAGVVLDLRGNGGGSPDEANRLLGGFGHGKVTAYQCAADGSCETMRTDDNVPLVGLPLVVLTDRVGVAPDEHVPLTPQDAAVGRDPALARALALLHD
ncbi:S41 family peptidase [Nonomuraea sp. WAC 01424]|uniref:S41 family peptidase n=1 Tax=Nonomuraea sp. WAC 01424 TaxID=2203200 RepID=UPI0021AD7C83|nr:S41 family peptidase [Nonomuraea sp. WAC 01424]